MLLFWVYAAVGVLAVIAAGLMRVFDPGLNLLSAGLRSALLFACARGLGLRPGPRTALSHAVLLGQHRGRPLRLELGGGRLLMSLGTRRDLDDAPMELTEHYVTVETKERRIDGYLRFEASSLVRAEPLLAAWAPRRLARRLEELHWVLEKLEAELDSPEALARASQSPRLRGALRARILEYRVKAHAEHAGTRELLVAARADLSAEVRITAARLSGAAGDPTLLDLASRAEALSGRAQRLLIDTLLERRPGGVEAALLGLARHARAKTAAYLLDALRAQPESLAVARSLLVEPGPDADIALPVRRAALRRLKEEHPGGDWREDALEILGRNSEPAALRQEVFEVLIASGRRRAALEALRPIAVDRTPLRAWGIAALAHHRGAREADWLFALARRDPTARLPVLFAFGDLGETGHEGETWLLECLHTRSVLVFEHTLAHLERVGTLRALPPLREMHELLGEPMGSRLLRAKVEDCIDRITRRLRGPAGVSGGLSLAPAEQHQGTLMLSPPRGAISAPDSIEPPGTGP